MFWPAMAVFVFAAGAAAAPPDPAVPPSTETDVLAMEEDAHRRLTIPVTIGGQGPFDFMIDTGAQATVLSRDLADQLELFDRKRATLVGVASRVSVETAWVPALAFGSRTVDVEVAPLVERAHIGGAHGVLGLDTLQNQRVLLDFPNGRIAVAHAEELGGNKGYEIVVRARKRLGQLIITQARLDGVRVSVVVDTGAQGSAGNPALLRRLARRNPIGTGELTDINGVKLAGSVYVAGELEIGRAGVRNFPLMITASPTFTELGLDDRPALILGMQELRLFRRVAIDFRTQRVLFDLPPGSTEAQMNGLNLSRI